MATDTKEKQQIKETTLKNTKLNVVKLNWKEVKPKINLLLATSALLVSTAWAQNESGFYRPLTRKDQDAYRIERLPSVDDLEWLRLK